METRTKSQSLRRGAAIVLGTALWLSAKVTAAEDSLLEKPEAHQGYYIALGALGLASFGSDRDRGALAPQAGIGGELRMGESLSPLLDLGIALAPSGVWSRDYGSFIGRLSLEMQLRPWDAIFLRAGLGFGVVDPTRRRSDLPKLSGRAGAEYVVAAGYELPISLLRYGSGGLTISPVIGVEGAPDRQLRSIAIFLGLEISFWTGRPKNELDLPVSQAF